VPINPDGGTHDANGQHAFSMTRSRRVSVGLEAMASGRRWGRAGIGNGSWIGSRIGSGIRGRSGSGSGIGSRSRRRRRIGSGRRSRGGRRTGPWRRRGSCRGCRARRTTLRGRRAAELCRRLRGGTKHPSGLRRRCAVGREGFSRGFHWSIIRKCEGRQIPVVGGQRVPRTAGIRPRHGTR
jgi:hypothetical protein